MNIMFSLNFIVQCRISATPKFVNFIQSAKLSAMCWLQSQVVQVRFGEVAGSTTTSWLKCVFTLQSKFVNSTYSAKTISSTPRSFVIWCVWGDVRVLGYMRYLRLWEYISLYEVCQVVKGRCVFWWRLLIWGYIRLNDIILGMSVYEVHEVIRGYMRYIMLSEGIR